MIASRLLFESEGGGGGVIIARADDNSSILLSALPLERRAEAAANAAIFCSFLLSATTDENACRNLNALGVSRTRCASTKSPVWSANAYKKH